MGEPLGGAQRQVVDLAQGKHAGDGEVGVSAASAPPRWGGGVAPLVHDALLDPEGEASAPHQG